MRKNACWIGGVLVAAVLMTTAWQGTERRITVSDGSRRETFAACAVSVGDILQQCGIKVGSVDQVYPGLRSWVFSDATVRITRAVPVTLTDYGVTRQLWARKGTRVGELLRQNRVPLGPNDLVSPKLNERIQAPLGLKVIRYSQKTTEEQVTIPFRQIKVADGDLERGISRKVSQGVPGMASETVRIVYHDGVEVRREVLSTRIIRPPQHEVVALGTITSVSRGSLRLDFKRAMLMEATAYTYTGHRTASGISPAVGLIAVDTRVIPMGTKLYVEGYGFARAADRGGAIRGNRIDLFMESVRECRQWGRRHVKIYVL
ncbi:MAG: 3D domain-containing protein [Solirubrobacterales bacterium]